MSDRPADAGTVAARLMEGLAAQLRQVCDLP